MRPLRLAGHPVHVMLIHFPVALWPAHFALHALAPLLPPGAAGACAFWILLGGVGLGWIAAGCGAIDLVALAGPPVAREFRDALIHGLVNGTALLGFTVIAGLEYGAYPHVHHGPPFLVAEAVLLIALFVGNYFGGAVVWRGRAPTATVPMPDRPAPGLTTRESTPP